MENDQRRTASEQGQGHRLQGEKSNIILWYGNEHVTMTLLPNKWQQPYHISVEHTAPHRLGGANQNDHRPHPTGGGGDKARNDDIATNKWQQPYHTSVEHTAPHRQGGANPKDHRPHSTRWGRPNKTTQEDGESTRPNKTTTHLTGKGRGLVGAAALHHICIIYIYVRVYLKLDGYIDR